MMVTLKTEADGKSKAKSQSFSVKQANELLSLSNAKWKLSDKAWEWNGKELAKAKK